MSTMSNRRPTQPVTVTPQDSNFFGDREEHPAFGMISASRDRYGPGGAVLFDSDIRHHETITVYLREASRSRQNKGDHVSQGKIIAEIEMSLAQWASFVSSLNTVGVPCTLRHTRDGALQEMPAIPFEPRLQIQLEETRQAAREAAADIIEAFEALEEGFDEKAGRAVMRELLRVLQARLENFAPNVEYAGKRLSEHAENVVQKARADVENMVLQHARQLGMSEEQITQALTAGLPIDRKEIEP